MKLTTFSTCIHFMGLVGENETGFMSLGGSCHDKKSVCLGDTDVILGRKTIILYWGAVEKMEVFLYQWEVE